MTSVKNVNITINFLNKNFATDFIMFCNFVVIVCFFVNQKCFICVTGSWELLWDTVKMDVEKYFICDVVFQEDDDVSVLTERGVTGIQKTWREKYERNFISVSNKKFTRNVERVLLN